MGRFCCVDKCIEAVKFHRLILKKRNGVEIPLSYTNSYIRGLRLAEIDDGTGTRQYTFNAHGDVTGLVDTTTGAVTDYAYDAYGNEDNASATDTNPFRYSGEYYDTETGFIYLRARYYDPSIGRFTAEDPIRDGTNWYVYCNNNPVMYVDPWGLFGKNR